MVVNRAEREAHSLEALDALDFIMSDGLQPLAQLSEPNGPRAHPRTPVASWRHSRDPLGLRGLLIWLRPLVRPLAD
jgi:hypothetical protein